MTNNTSNNNEQKPFRIAVLGGGISGITTAMKLAQTKKATIDLYEKYERTGGLQRCTLINEYCFDIGAFIFWDDYDFFNTFPTTKELFRNIDVIEKKISQKNNVQHFTFTIGEFLRENGLRITLTAIFRQIFAHSGRKEITNTRDRLVSKLGITFYEYFGLKNYIENLYKLEDKKIGDEFVTQRMQFIANSSIWQAIRRKIFRKLKKIATTKDIFYGRPEGGFETIFSEVEKQLLLLGVNIQTAQNIETIDLNENQYTIKTSKGESSYDYIVSTIPLPSLIKLLNKKPIAEYPYLNLVSLFYKGQQNYSGSLFHNYSKNGKWKKIVSLSTLYKDNDSVSHFTVEISLKDKDKIVIEELKADFEQSMEKINLISDLEYCGSEITHNAYPVFLEKQSKKVLEDLKMIHNLGIITTGRQGLYIFSSSKVTLKKANESIEGLLKNLCQKNKS